MLATVESDPCQNAAVITDVRVLAVDDISANLRLIKRLLVAPAFHVMTASTPEDALIVIEQQQPDVVLMDVRMPGRDGFDLCRELKRNLATRFVPVILITAGLEATDKLRAIEAGADDFVSKPLNACELSARVRALARMKRYTDELESAEQLMVSLALTIEARDVCTDGHCQRLALYGRQLGQALHLDAADLRALERGGYLHDVGKIGIPDAVLLKRGPLTPQEYDVMKDHTVIGERLCSGLRSLSNVTPIVRHHHERLDGSGYPDGLRGHDIPLLAQIIGLVDVYDAMMTTRPYRAALPRSQVVAALREEVRCGWRNADLTELWIELSSHDSKRGVPC
jgi:putative two-component system response regulator